MYFGLVSSVLFYLENTSHLQSVGYFFITFRSVSAIMFSNTFSLILSLLHMFRTLIIQMLALSLLSYET